MQLSNSELHESYVKDMVVSARLRTLSNHSMTCFRSATIGQRPWTTSVYVLERQSTEYGVGDMRMHDTAYGAVASGYSVLRAEYAVPVKHRNVGTQF